jgi:signal transduction histidine kinase
MERFSGPPLNELFASVLRQLPAAVIIAAPDGRIVLANEQVQFILRQNDDPPENIAAYRTRLRGFHPDGKPYADDEWPIARTIATGELVEEEDISVVRGDGTFGVIRVSSAPIRDGEGTLVAAVITFHDVTDEKREHDALTLIADASAIVAEALEYDRTLQRMARLAVPRFADLVFIHLLDRDGNLARQEVAASDREREAEIRSAWGRFPTLSEPLLRVIESGESTMSSVIPVDAWDAIVDPDHREALTRFGIRSAMTVPIRGTGKPYGTMTFVLTSTQRAYDAFDLLVAEELARRAGAAIERSRLFEGEREQRLVAERSTHRVEYLQRLTSMLAQAVTIEEAVAAVTTELRAVLLATVVIIGLVTEDGEQIRIAGSAGLADEVEDRYRYVPLTTEIPLTQAVLSHEAIFIGTREEAERRSPFVRDARPDSRAWAAIPLEMRGRVIGVLGLSFPEDHPFDVEERSFIASAAAQCALALERSMLFDSERHAREEAEHASRAKDEFLAILSHELRTPLTSVLGWADLLRMTHENDPVLVEQLTALRKAALMQARLIDDLLDVSRIVTGKLRITRRSVELNECVCATAEAQRLNAEAGGIALICDTAPEPIVLNVDADRIQQVVGNLVANALKFTPRGGEVRLSVRRENDRAIITVRDTGDGISPEFLPQVFDRFRQASVGDSRNYSGLGLGLSIVQHLVQLHGGSVKAESDGLGKGATFTVTLPLT